MNETFEKIARAYRQDDGNVITLLQETQEAFGYIPREAIDYFSTELNIASSRFYGVVTFYAQFRLTPRGKNVITACCGTACHVKGSERILNSVVQELKLPDSKDVTDDGLFTLERVNCVGACGIAPVFIVNKQIHGKATAEKILRELRELKGIAHAKQ